MIKNWLRKVINEGGVLLASALFFFFCTVVLSVKSSSISSQHVFYNPPKSISLMTFGYNDTFADVLWLRVIQDFDICERTVDRTTNEPCDNSWVYRMLDVITDLAPKLRIAYVDGGSDLEIIVHDHYGAGRIFEKGLIFFPHYWSLEYRAAYHYIFEEKETTRAADLLISAYKDGGPNWLPSLAGRIMSEDGKGQLAIKVLSGLMEDLPDGPLRNRLEIRIQEIKHRLLNHESIKDF